MQHCDPLPVSGRREAVAAAVRNLFENAIRVKPDGDDVIARCGPGPQMRVSDGGQGTDASLPAQDVTGPNAAIAPVQTASA